MNEVDIEALAAAHRSGAVVVDVREVHEYAAGHVPGALLLPLPQLAGGLGRLPQDRPVLVVCASGNRSRAATELLRRAGYDAASVAGGTAAWADSGRPLETGGPGSAIAAVTA